MIANLTFSKTGLLLFTSSTPTMTWAVDDKAWGPPEALSSVAVTLRTYSTPWRRGGGLERKRIKPTTKHKDDSGKHAPSASVDIAVTFSSLCSTFMFEMKRNYLRVSFSSALKPESVSVCVCTKASVTCNGMFPAPCGSCVSGLFTDTIFVL